SHLSRFPCRVIPYGIDLEQFSPREPRAARHALGLPQDKLLVAAVAANWDNPHKGGDLLLDIAAGLRGQRLGRVVAAGRMTPPTRQRLEGQGAIVRDGLHSADTIRGIFSACDGALLFSKAAN